MKSALRLTVAGAVSALVAVSAGLPATGADSPGVTIVSVGDRQVVAGKVPGALTGVVPVRGTASPSGDTADPEPGKPLVADAGDSGFVASGERAVLLGSAYGGTAPYSFSWTSPVGELDGANSSSVELDTTDVAAGVYEVTLKVVDASGASTTDAVRVVVYEPATSTLLDQTESDTSPGTAVTGEHLDFPFVVPQGTSRIEVALSFEGAANDYDLEVLDPGGKEAATSGASAGESESASVTTPVAGTWTARAVKFATVPPDEVHVTVTASTTGADPRPQVSTTGPYAFETGTPQTLSGSLAGGTAPVTAGWDLDGDGVFESAGTRVVANLSDGRHLVTFKAMDAAGLERRETTSVLVGQAGLVEGEAPITVVGVADTGINPYHLEFSVGTYPDPDVLARTGNFTKHPSTYIPGYPESAQALPVTLGQGYFPDADSKLWQAATTPIKQGELYWIPGTKIVGAIDTSASSGATSGEDTHPILDDNGHGSGSASVSAGNRYGYCPTCLLVVVEGLDETVAARLPWVDISTNSFGYVGGAPVGPIVNGSEVTKAAAERGQTTLFAAGNGVGNAFDVPVNTWHSDQTGPDWNITVGALRRDNQRAIVGDGIPVHVSAWGDGNLPSACRSGTVGQCAFGGTSAATPYTAGVFGTVLTKVRAAIGDPAAGQKPGQVVAKGLPMDDSIFLADGALTRDELRQAVLKTAFPLNQDNDPSVYPYPLTASSVAATNVLFEGYGAATPNSAGRAVDVLVGAAPMPDRTYEDEFFSYDRAVRDTLWGGFDRDGDGKTDSDALAGGLGLDASQLTTEDAALSTLRKVAQSKNPEVGLRTLGSNPLTYWLHRKVTRSTDPLDCTAANNEQYMDRSDTSGDREPCFDSRVTSVVAAFRPVAIFAATDTLDAPLPAGSKVNVELFLAAETPSVVRPTGVLMATDREIGKGEGLLQPVTASGPTGAACPTLGEACWTKYSFSFEITRPAFTGEALTFQLQLLGARSWAIGHEGAHASKLAIEPAPLPATGFDFGTTITSPAGGSMVYDDQNVVAGGSYSFPDQGEDPAGAGDHPATRVIEVSVDDASFATPVRAVLDENSGTWRADLGKLPAGEHLVYSRARIDTTTSAAATSRFTVEPAASPEWQVVSRNAATDPQAWRPATGLNDWSFQLNTTDHGSGPKTIVVRLTEHGDEIARDTVRATFR
ncbi:S8 family serine peptidase [Kribbella turkmenica]|nr:S8 family serine peptidase [Kribbella turkmenica]